MILEIQVSNHLNQLRYRYTYTCMPANHTSTHEIEQTHDVVCHSQLFGMRSAKIAFFFSADRCNLLT